MSALHRRRARAALAVAGTLLAVTAALAMAGCGVPLDSAPRPITQTTIAPTDATPTTIASTGAPEVSVYFLNGDRLQRIGYPVEGDPTIRQALDFVLAAPPESSDEDLHTSVPPGTELRSVEVTGGVATVDLTSAINDVSGPAQKEAFAQIVFTALAFDEVQSVRFLIDGEPIDAPTDDGNLAEVSAGNYDAPLNPR